MSKSSVSASHRAMEQAPARVIQFERRLSMERRLETIHEEAAADDHYGPRRRAAAQEVMKPMFQNGHGA
ncbi:hypothetical protein QJS10_CPB21g00138 [Acorus calamus]|uniref:Uncharacterized protein n=1 Tax=Acorus calamus TaxID=4465 RepID=A0AAV9C412_ACOCL|nr:hypothetical protein QJS10_CPB21g00138 [Acorus calamus]